MDLLKTYFPLSFKLANVTSLIIAIVIYIIVDAIMGLICFLLWWVPVIGVLLSILGTIVGLYTLAGVVLALLSYFKVIQE